MRKLSPKWVGNYRPVEKKYKFLSKYRNGVTLWVKFLGMSKALHLTLLSPSNYSSKNN